jgi:hypothetical protein
MIYAFPARIVRLTPENEEINGLQHLPLAFDALLEGNAQAIQRSIIETLWGKEVADYMFLLSGASVRQPDQPVNTPAYNVTDLMVSRYMQNEAGDRRFPRSALLALADHALTSAIVIRMNPDQTHTLSMECPGHAFVDLLSNTGAAAIRAGQIPPPKDEGYAQLRDYYASVEAFEMADDKLAGPIADLEVFFRWVSRYVIAPLLEARLRTHHQVFSDPMIWMTEMPNLPPVPFRIRPDGTTVSNAPSRVVHAWLNIRMIERMLAQLIIGEPAILCPRAHGTAPGIERVNFAHTGNCDEYVAEDLCGRFYTGMPLTALPECRFRDNLFFLGFSMPPKRDTSGGDPEIANVSG